MWESHSNANGRRYIAPTLTGTQSICSVSDQPVKLVNPVAAVGATPSVGWIELETSLRKLLQNVAPTLTGTRSVGSASNQLVGPVDPVGAVGATPPVGVLGE